LLGRKNGKENKLNHPTKQANPGYTQGEERFGILFVFLCVDGNDDFMILIGQEQHKP